MEVPLSPDEPLPLAGHREDVYFPASEAAGVKLRNGHGELEVKLRTQASDAGGVLQGCAEYWVKEHHSGCVFNCSGQVQVDAEACASAVGKSVKELFAEGGGRPLPIRVLCRKKRRYINFGTEEVDCVFMAILDGARRPCLVERYRSVSVEGYIESIVKVVKGMKDVPAEAIVCGYPSIVQTIAKRALAQTGGELLDQSTHSAHASNVLSLQSAITSEEVHDDAIARRLAFEEDEEEVNDSAVACNASLE